MDPKTQKLILYIVGGILAAGGLWLEQAHLLPPGLALIPGAMGWLGGYLKGKAADAPGASKPQG